MSNNGREEGQFVSNNVRSITSITPPLPLFSSQTGRVARTGRRRCRRNASYICVGCTRDGHIFVPLPRCRSRWQSKWQPTRSPSSTTGSGARPDPYMYVSTRCRKRYRTEFCHNVDAQRASNVLPQNFPTVSMPSLSPRIARPKRRRLMPDKGRMIVVR